MNNETLNDLDPRYVLETKKCNEKGRDRKSVV